MKKAIILSSGGVDSTTCVSLAVDRLGAENVVTASIFLWAEAQERDPCGTQGRSVLPCTALRI